MAQDGEILEKWIMAEGEIAVGFNGKIILDPSQLLPIQLLKYSGENPPAIPRAELSQQRLAKGFIQGESSGWIFTGDHCFSRQQCFRQRRVAVAQHWAPGKIAILLERVRWHQMTSGGIMFSITRQRLMCVIGGGYMRALVVGSSALCIVVGFIAGTSYGASQASSNVTNLLHDSLSENFIPDREVLVDLVEIPPNSQLDRHWHPGEEFHYYLAGDPEITIEGKGLTRPALGTVGHVPFETLHRAGAGKAGAKIIVFRVHTKGKPWRYLENEHDEAHDAVRK